MLKTRWHRKIVVRFIFLHFFTVGDSKCDLITSKSSSQLEYVDLEKRYPQNHVTVFFFVFGGWWDSWLPKQFSCCPAEVTRTFRLDSRLHRSHSAVVTVWREVNGSALSGCKWNIKNRRQLLLLGLHEAEIYQLKRREFVQLIETRTPSSLGGSRESFLDSITRCVFGARKSQKKCAMMMSFFYFNFGHRQQLIYRAELFCDAWSERNSNFFSGFLWRCVRLRNSKL